MIWRDRFPVNWKTLMEMTYEEGPDSPESMVMRFVAMLSRFDLKEDEYIYKSEVKEFLRRQPIRGV